MFVTLVLLFILCQTKGEEVRYRCRETQEKSMSFTPVDSVPGRYELELCLPMNPNVTLWNIELWYFQTCNSRKPQVHSLLKGQPIEGLYNCSNVCYAVVFDIIYTGCYKIQSELKNAEEKTLVYQENKYPVKNNLTLDSFSNSKIQVIYIPNNKDVTLRWVLNVPVPYKHSVCVKQVDNSSEYSSLPCYPDDLVRCTLFEVSQLWCTLVLPPSKCYEATLELEPIWYPVLNTLTESRHQFCLARPAPPAVDGAAGDAARSAAAWWTAGGALLALGAAAAALLARRACRERAYHKRVLEAWMRARECEAPRVEDVEPSSHNILLLYAREGEHGQRAIAALKALLQHSFGGQVLDAYAAEVVGRAAPAPGAWLRGALAGARTKVLLLQSPALLRLYATTVRDSGMQLQEPLLGRAALYRRPHFGDQLVLLALRLMSESVAAHHQYHKYYIATYAGLPTDVVPALVPYRRYELPLGAAALLADLAPAEREPAAPAPAPAPAPLLQLLAHAADEFTSHARAHPDYLADELVTV